jgi:hypothetical protein
MHGQQNFKIFKVELRVKVTTSKQSNVHVFTIINEWPKPGNNPFRRSFGNVYVYNKSNIFQVFEFFFFFSFLKQRRIRVSVIFVYKSVTVNIKTIFQ